MGWSGSWYKVALFDGPRRALRREVAISQHASADSFWVGLALPLQWAARDCGRSALLPHASAIGLAPETLALMTQHMSHRIPGLLSRPRLRLDDILHEYAKWLGINPPPPLSAEYADISLPAGVMHGDLLPKNVLVSGAFGEERLAVIDWELGLERGSPTSDLLRFSVGLFQAGATSAPLQWLDELSPYSHALVERHDWIHAGLIISTLSLLGWGADRDRNATGEIVSLWESIERYEGPLTSRSWLTDILLPANP